MYHAKGKNYDESSIKTVNAYTQSIGHKEDRHHAYTLNYTRI